MRYEFGMNSLGLLTLGKRRRAGWAPLGRSVAYQATRNGTCWAAMRATRRGEKRNWSGPAGGVSVHGHISGLNHFLFSKLVFNLQITLNSTQI
jgi:hypothetical protein